MAANSRTFNLTIAGVQQSITSVSTLQTTVSTLQQKFDDATFGTVEFDQLNKELKEAEKALKQVQTATQNTSAASDKAGQNAKKMGTDFQAGFGIASLAAGETGNIIGQLEGGFGQATNGLGKLKDGFGTLKGAIASTGIGVLLIAFGFLISYFTKSQEGINFINQKTKALQAVFQLLSDRAVAVGKALFETFSNPQKALTSLVQGIQNNLVNRLKSFSVILDGIINKDFTKVADGFLQMGTGVTNGTAKVKGLAKAFNQLGIDTSNAIKETERIAKSNQQIIKDERELNAERVRTDTQLKKLKLIQDDGLKSVKARMDATQKAFDLEKPLVEKELQLQNRRIVNLKAEQHLKQNLTNEDFDAMAELEKRREEINSATFDKQAELTAKLSGFVQQETSTNLASVAAKKAANDKASVELKALKDKDLSDTTAAAAISLDIRKRQLDAELVAAQKGSSEQLRVLKEQKKLETDTVLESIDDKYLKAGVKEKAALILQREEVVKAGYVAQIKVETDFEAERVTNAKQNEADLAAIKLLGLKEGSKEYYAALVEQITAEESLALSKLEKTKENETARNKIIAEAEQKRKDIIKTGDAGNDVAKSFLTKILGVAPEDVDKNLSMLVTSLTTAQNLASQFLQQANAARLKAIDAQVAEADAIIAKAKDAADALTNQLNDSDSRINQLEDKLLTTRGAARERILAQLTIERQRNAQINADKVREDARSKAAQLDKVELEKQKTAEQEKQSKVQTIQNTIAAAYSVIAATNAALDAISAISKAGAGGKFGFDNIAYLLAATAGIVAAGFAVKGAVAGFDAGGYTGGGFGTPDESGYKVAGVVHENEWVAPKWMVTSPKYSNTLAQLEAARTSGSGFAVGGFVTPAQGSSGADLSLLIAMQESIQTLQIQLGQVANKPMFVRPTDIQNYNNQSAIITDTFFK